MKITLLIEKFDGQSATIVDAYDEYTLEDNYKTLTVRRAKLLSDYQSYVLHGEYELRLVEIERPDLNMDDLFEPTEI